jgi:hypothetical protein
MSIALETSEKHPPVSRRTGLESARREVGTHGLQKKDSYLNLNAEAHHHPSQKMAVVNTLVSRAIDNCEPGNPQKEKKHLVRTLETNGYSLEVTEELRNRLNYRKVKKSLTVV